MGGKSITHRRIVAQGERLGARDLGHHGPVPKRAILFDQWQVKARFAAPGQPAGFAIKNERQKAQWFGLVGHQPHDQPRKGKRGGGQILDGAAGCMTKTRAMRAASSPVKAAYRQATPAAPRPTRPINRRGKVRHLDHEIATHLFLDARRAHRTDLGAPCAPIFTLLHRVRAPVEFGLWLAEDDHVMHHKYA